MANPLIFKSWKVALNAAWSSVDPLIQSEIYTAELKRLFPNYSLQVFMTKKRLFSQNIFLNQKNIKQSCDGCEQIALVVRSKYFWRNIKRQKNETSDNRGDMAKPVEVGDVMLLEKCWSCRHVSPPPIRDAVYKFKNRPVLISCHPYHLLGPLHNSCLLFFPPPPGLGFHQTADWWTCSQWGGRCPPAADIRPHARLYSHKMTPFRSTLALQESYDIASCVWLYGGQGSFRY